MLPGRASPQVEVTGTSEELLDVPFMPQSELLCGGAAAAMVLRYWGATGIDAEDFASLVRPEEGGIRGEELAADVRRRGWRAEPFRGDAAEVRRHVSRGRPVVALLEVGPDRYHFVVVVAWTDDGVLFHDPADAPFQALDHDDFDAAWAATDRWSLLILPGEDLVAAPRPGRAADAPPSPTDVPNRDISGACDASIRDAVRLAREGESARAEEGLREALGRCPSSARARAELAGLHAARDDWEGARGHAEKAVGLDPSSTYAWRILATARYLTGDRVAALNAWNRLGEPRIERVRIEGLAGARYGPVMDRTGLAVDRILTAEDFTTAARRLDLLPSARSTRLSYEPLSDGRAEVRANLLPHPIFPSTPTAWAATALRGSARRSVVLRSGSPLGAAELWSLEGRWEEHRPAVAVSVAVPGLPGLPGTATLAGGWERQTYRPERPGGASLVEERRLARFTLEDWAAPWLRWEAGTGLDRWSDGPSDLGFRAGIELRGPEDRLSLRLDGRWARSVGSAVERSYGTTGLEARARSSTVSRGPVLHVRAGFETVSSDAPLAAWPGAGEGRVREALLRGHPLLNDGIVAGSAFGRRLAHGSIEGRWWSRAVPGLPLGAALFVDAARAWEGLGTDDGEVLVDGGGGLRAALPGERGVVRADLARPLDEGGWRFTVGWEGAWPGTRSVF